MKKVEIWKPIPSWEGFYDASSLGRIKSLKRKVSSRGVNETILIPAIQNSGYQIVGLSVKNKVTTCLVHRLVAITHIPNPFRKAFVNHKNGIKTDNRLDNLEWCTKSENIKHAYSIGLKTISQKHLDRLRKFNSETKSKKICQYELDGEYIKTYNSGVEASKLVGCNYFGIMACANPNNKKTKSCGGYIWAFANQPFPPKLREKIENNGFC